MLCREKYPDTDVYVFYIDVRTPGKNFDEFYRRAVEEYGVHTSRAWWKKSCLKTESSGAGLGPA